LRMAEFGFLGVVVYTRTHTPLRCGQEVNAADLLVFVLLWRPFLTSCDIVGIRLFTFVFSDYKTIFPH